MKSGEIKFAGGKPYLLIDNREKAAIPMEFGLTIDDHEGYFVDENEYELKYDSSIRSDVVIWLIVDGDEFLAKKSSHKEQSKKNDSLDEKRVPARAPYNFIPLNKVIVSAQEIPDFDTFHNDRESGYIDLTITNETPFFIRGRKWDDIKKDWLVSEDFFNWQDGKPVIPGSSLRGMIRSLVEVVSWSKMEFTDKERKLFHRGMFQQSLKTAYEEERRLLDRNRPGDKQDETVGLLKFENGRYVIYPSTCLGECPKRHEQKFSFYNGNWEVHPGNAPGNRNKGWKITLPAINTIPIEIPNNVVKEYLSDETRSEKVPNVLECAKNEIFFKQFIIGAVPSNITDKGVPVFYEEKQEGEAMIITSFGVPRNYRIAYPKTIGDHIIQDEWTNPENTVDFANAIFGQVDLNDGKAKKSSRVFFEDGYVKDGYETGKRTVSLPLMTPKPTTFQHYLIQPTGYRTSESDLKHWGDKGENAPIRGYKNYWHRKTASIPSADTQNSYKTWAKENLPDHKVYEVDGIKQLPIYAITKAEFHQRIRFENLSKEELGCLLLVLEMPEGMHHKLGLGKPLGLGSVHIQPANLTLINKGERYKQLFNENMNYWNLGEKSTIDWDEYKKAFVKYMAVQLNNDYTTVNDFWNEKERMVHLKAMLIFDHKITDWLERTRYMEIEKISTIKKGEQTKNEYKYRPVLPYPDEVIKFNTYKPTT